MLPIHQLRIGMVVLAAGFAGVASAEPPAAEITPYLGYRMGGSIDTDDPAGSYDLADASGFGLIVNFMPRKNTRVELLYARQDTDAVFDGVTVNDGTIDLELHSLELGGTYDFDGDTVQPYLAATIGGTHVRASSSGNASDTFLSGSIGLGVRFFPAARLGLRVEARARGVLIASDTNLFCATGPDTAVCAVTISGDWLGQVETFAGVSLRF